MDAKETKSLFLGIDGGGSKCKAVLVSADKQVLGAAISGPANPFHGFEAAMASVVDAAEKALEAAGLPTTMMSELIVGAGLAGVNLPNLFERVEQWQHPFKHFYLATDLHIASLGAHGGNDGAVIIAGTGSCGYSHIDNVDIVVGGHGFPHGDKGSGAWFGLQVVEHVLLAMDGIERPTRLQDELLRKLGCQTDVALVEAIADYTPADYGKLAGLLFAAAEANDEVALSIVKDGAQYLNDVAEKLWVNSDSALAMIGGITGLLRPYLSDKVTKNIVDAKDTPEMGAVYFAMKRQAQTFSAVS